MALKDSVLNIVIKARDAASDVFGKFTSNLKKTDTSAKQAEGGLTSTAKAAKELSEGTDKTASSLERAETKLKGAAGASRQAGSELKKTGETAGSAAQNIEKTGEASEKTARDIKKTGEAAIGSDGALEKLTRTVRNLVAGYLSFTALKGSISAILSTGDEFERYGNQLEAVMGTIEGGEKATEWLKDFAPNTPYQLGELTEGFVKLKAFGLDPMNGTYQAIIDQTSKLGGSQETLNGVILGLGQAWAKQKLQGEEILQLVERGVPVWDLLAKATGKNVLELQELSAAGKLGRAEISALITEIGKSSEGATAKQMGTLSGLISNIKDHWVQFLATVADSGVLDYVKEQLTLLIAKFKELKDDGSLQRWAKQISEAFVEMGNSVKETLTNSFGSVDNFKTSVTTSLSAIKSVISGTYNAFALLGNGIASAGNLAVISWSLMISKMAGLAGKLTDVLGADQLAKDARKIAEEADGVFQEYSNSLSKHGEDIKANAAAIWNAIAGESSKGAQKVAESSSTMTDGIKQSLDEVLAVTNELHASLAQQASAVDGQVAAAAARTASAWSAVYKAQGEAQEKALVELNTAIAEEERLRIDQSMLAAQLIEAEQRAIEARAEVEKQAREEQSQGLDEAMQKLRQHGVDMTRAMTGISDAARKSIDGIGDIADELKKLPLTAKQSGDAMQQAIVSAISKMSTTKELDALEAKLREVFKGDESGALAAALELIRQKAEEIKETDMDKPFRDVKNSLTEILDLQDKIDNKPPPGEQGYKYMATANEALKSQVEAVRTALGELSDQALATFDQGFLGRTALTEMDEARAKLAEMSAKIADIEQYSYRLNAGGVGDWMNKMQVSAAQASKAFYEQKVQFLSLIEAVESGNLSLARLDALSKSAGSQFKLLDETDLSRLNSAIDSARQKIEGLNASAAATLANLRNELDQMEGNVESVQERNYEQQRKQLEQQLKEAQDAGAKDAAKDVQDALKAAEELHKRKLQQIKNEAAAKRQAEQEAAAEKARVQAEQAQAKAQTQQPKREPTTVIKLEGPGGKSVPVEIDADRANDLLDVLAAAGMRSSRA